MTIDEAIKHAEEVASRLFDDRVHCIKCAEEHQQLAAWLKELKQLKEKEPKIGHWIKEKSMYYDWDGYSYYCSECGRVVHKDEFEDMQIDYPYCHCGAKMEEEE